VRFAVASYLSPDSLVVYTPYTQLAIAGAGYDQISIRAEDKARPKNHGPLNSPFKDDKFGARLHIPQPHRAITDFESQYSAVWA
jgi:hypothetical protein